MYMGGKAALRGVIISEPMGGSEALLKRRGHLDVACTQGKPCWHASGAPTLMCRPQRLQAHGICMRLHM